MKVDERDDLDIQMCYEDRIVEIRFDWEPTEEQMAIVGQKLNP